MSFAFSQHIVVGPDVMIRAVGEESVLLNLKTELYLGLDFVGTRMWLALTESASVQDAFNVLLDEFDVAPEELRRDIEEFVGELLHHRLVEIDSDQASVNRVPS